MFEPITDMDVSGVNGSEAFAYAGKAADRLNGSSADRNPLAPEKKPVEPDKKTLAGKELDESEQREVQELKRRDQQVRAHEQAHMAAAGGFARGGPSYEFTQGPDGKQYAVGGEVQIDTSPVPDNPRATLTKAQTIRAAALAPAQPSGADHSVAAAASKMEAEARRELAETKEASSPGQIPGGKDGEAPQPGKFLDILA